MNIHVNHTIRTSIYKQIATQMKEQILSGEIAAGSTLPSERSLAQRLGVHRNTVVKAYAELKAEELIESRQGVGYVVVLPEISPSGGREKKVYWTGQIRDEYVDMEVTFDDLFQRFDDEDIISLGSGLATTEIYNKEQVAADIASFITEEGKNQYFYSPYQGDKVLRQKIVSYLSTKGIRATTGEIQILAESNQALDFIVELLLKPGDAVLMEEPVSPDVYRTVELAGGKVVTIPMDQDGIHCDRLEELVLHHRPRFLYVNSSFHDPTGAVLSQERRNVILDISRRHGLIVVEDDAASELVYSGAKLPPLKTYDTLNNVVYIYSFSMTFMPGLSLAFVVGDRNLIRSLSYLVSVRMMAGDWLAQKLAAKYLGDGSYYQALEIFRDSYALKQELICRKLDEMRELGVDYVRPRGGVYVWVKLPESVDSRDLVTRAYHDGVAILPGYVFYPYKNGGRNHIRLNYSYESAENILEGMDRLKSAIEWSLAHKK